jgi:hypothetical protein
VLALPLAPAVAAVAQALGMPHAAAAEVRALMPLWSRRRKRGSSATGSAGGLLPSREGACAYTWTTYRGRRAQQAFEHDCYRDRGHGGGHICSCGASA